MAESIDQTELEEFLRRVGLVDPKYNGPVVVTAKTSTGEQSVTIKI
jgi:hypothetical protein